jgi:hypothetical protein
VRDLVAAFGTHRTPGFQDGPRRIPENYHGTSDWFLSGWHIETYGDLEACPATRHRRLAEKIPKNRSGFSLTRRLYDSTDMHRRSLSEGVVMQSGGEICCRSMS